MRTFLTAVLVAACLLACGSENGSNDAQISDVDARTAVTNDASDAADAVEDTDPIDQTDAADESEADEQDEVSIVDDTYEIIENPIDAGIDCSENEDICEGSFDCVQGVCTLDISVRSYVEQSYQFTEPEELIHVFDFVKTFAANVAFLMLEISDEGDPWRRPTRYGAADRIVEQDTLDVVYAWQFPIQDRFLLEPIRGDEGLFGNVFQSNIFQWNLKAHVVMDRPAIDVTFGFVAELTQVYIEFSSDLQVGTGEFRGIITRREAENRVLGDTEFEPFRALVCQVHPDLLPLGGDWRLADILDCNATPMDMDLNGDGILDGYKTVVEMRVEPATIVESDD